jgi:hypothetical protein
MPGPEGGIILRWGRSTSQPLDGLLDECDALGQRTRGYLNEPEPEVAVRLLVHLLENERVLEADPSGRGGLQAWQLSYADRADSMARSSGSWMSGGASDHYGTAGSREPNSIGTVTN